MCAITVSLIAALSRCYFVACLYARVAVQSIDTSLDQIDHDDALKVRRKQV